MAKITIDPEEMVSIDDAAEQLNISVITAWRWVRSGKLKTTKLFGRTLVNKADLAALSNEAIKE